MVVFSFRSGCIVAALLSCLVWAHPSCAFDLKKIEGYWGSSDPNGYLTLIRDGQMWQCKNKIDGPRVFYRRFQIIENNPKNMLVFIQHKSVIERGAVYMHTGKEADDPVVNHERSEFMLFHDKGPGSWPEIFTSSCYSQYSEIPPDLDVDKVSKDKILDIYYKSDCPDNPDHWLDYSLGSDMRLTKEIAGNYPPLCYAIAPDMISWAVESKNDMTQYKKPLQSSYPPFHSVIPK